MFFFLRIGRTDECSAAYYGVRFAYVNLDSFYVKCLGRRIIFWHHAEEFFSTCDINCCYNQSVRAGEINKVTDVAILRSIYLCTI